MWVAYSLLSAFTFASVNALDKFVISKKEINPIFFIAIQSIIDIFLAIVLILLTKPPLEPILFLALLVGIMIPFTDYLYFKSISKEEVSRVVPWFESSLLFTAVFSAVFLKEFFEIIQYAGILILFLGLFLLTIKQGFKVTFNRWILMILLASLIYALIYIVEKFTLKTINPWQLLAVAQVGSVIGSLPLILPNRSIIKESLTTKRSAIKYVALSELIAVTAFTLLLLALNQGLATLVAVVMSSQYLFLLLITVSLSVFRPAIIREEIDRKTIGLKVIALILVSLGIYLANL